MHHEKEEIICPNCGTHASGNYCYECGQQTHLHKDTFGGLILHFFEHYFHYDNKFWQTIRTLLFKPGELTIAYWKQQRMRYISPVSLYIFISAVFFSLTFLSKSKPENVLNKNIDNIHKNNQSIKQAPVNVEQLSGIDFVIYKLENKPELLIPIAEKIQHTVPKIYFFLIPFTALLLKLLFFRRKELYYVDHLIFSLHFHSLYFLLNIPWLLLMLLPMAGIGMLISIAVIVFEMIYLIKALSVAYKISTGRAVGYTVILGFIYFLIMASIMLIYFYYLLRYVY